jgi:hypothetical protein
MLEGRNPLERVQLAIATFFVRRRFVDPHQLVGQSELFEDPLRPRSARLRRRIEPQGGHRAPPKSPSSGASTATMTASQSRLHTIK